MPPLESEPRSLKPEARPYAVAAELEDEVDHSSPRPFDPDAADWGVFFRVGSYWVTDPDFDLVSEGDVITRSELGVSWEPGLLHDDLIFELAYAVGSREAAVFDRFDASLTLQSIQGSAVYRQLVSKYSRAYARGTLSADFALLTIEDRSGEVELDDVATTAGIEGTLGWEVLIPVGSSRTKDGRPEHHLSLAAEAGYGFRPLDARFDELERDAGDDVHPARIALAPTAVGGLDLSGWVLRFAGAYRW